MYLFWELVGVSSYLLIGFYYTKPEAIAASKKAFIVTRFADLGFLIGILFYARSNVSYLFGDTWAAQTAYKILALIMMFVGGLTAYTFVWDLGDVGVGLMTVFNLIALIPMSKEALVSLRDYEAKYKKS